MNALSLCLAHTLAQRVLYFLQIIKISNKIIKVVILRKKSQVVRRTEHRKEENVLEVMKIT